jgi:hypothetical protein
MYDGGVLIVHLFVLSATRLLLHIIKRRRMRRKCACVQIVLRLSVTYVGMRHLDEPYKDRCVMRIQMRKHIWIYVISALNMSNGVRIAMKIFTRQNGGKLYAFNVSNPALNMLNGVSTATRNLTRRNGGEPNAPHVTSKLFEKESAKKLNDVQQTCLETIMDIR